MIDLKSGIVLICVFLVIVISITLVLVMIVNTRDDNERVPENRRKNISFKKGVNVKTKRQQADRDIEKLIDYPDTVVIRGNDDRCRYISVVLRCEKSGQVHNIKIYDHVVLGRSTLSSRHYYHITDQPTVSKQHCKLFVQNNAVYIVDVGSTHHTYVNGNIVYKNTRIKRGDMIGLGKNAKYIVISI